MHNQVRIVRIVYDQSVKSALTGGTIGSTVGNTILMDQQIVVEPARSSLGGLGYDILVLIVEYLQKSDIASLCLVNSYLNKISKHGFYRDMSFNLMDGIETLSQRLLKLEQHGCLASVRSMKIADISRREVHLAYKISHEEEKRKQDAASVDQQIQLLSQYVPQMTGLKDVYLQGCDLPFDLLSIIKARTGVRLTVQAETMGRYAPSLEHLIDNGNLCALDIRHQYLESSGCTFVTKRLREVLLTCPNLRILRLHIEDKHEDPDFNLHSEMRDYIGMGFHDGERPPALEDLEIVDYPFGNLESGDPDEPRYNSGGYPAHLNEWDYWVDVFDWSKLRKLRAQGNSFAFQVLQKTSALEEVSLRATFVKNEMKHWDLMALPNNLKALELDTYSAVRAEIVRRHRASLQRLRLHGPERSKVSWKTSVFLDESIRLIAKECPNVETLALNMPRKDGDWSYSTLDSLAGFCRLEDLTLWFEIGINKPYDIPKPYVTFASAAKLFEYLRNGNSRLRKLTVHSGSLEDPVRIKRPSGVVDFLWQPLNESKVFEWCTTLTEQENEILQRVHAHSRDGSGLFDALLSQAIEIGDKALPKKIPGFVNRYRVAWRAHVYYSNDGFQALVRSLD